MSDTDRVRAWRDRLKQAGRVPMTIWVTAATKTRYEDLALTYHRSPSELAQQALDAYRPAQGSVADTVTDTEQIRTLISAEIAQLSANVTDTVTATVTETLLAQLPSLLQDHGSRVCICYGSRDGYRYPTSRGCCDTSPSSCNRGCYGYATATVPSAQPGAHGGGSRSRSGVRGQAPTAEWSTAEP